MDTKYALHLFRLLGEGEQLLSTGNMDLTIDRARLKLVKKGLYTLPEIETYFKETEKRLEKVYAESTLPYSPRVDEVRKLLVECLDQFYKGGK